MAVPNILIYLLRHDLRIADNPVLHHLATTAEHGFTHVLPVYVFPAHQIEISGFLRENAKSPYPEARSQIGKFWRCGHHRTKFVAESVWNLKESLEKVGSGLALRAGRFGDVAEDLLQGFADKQQKVGAIWMTSEEAIEEKKDEEDVSTACKKHGVAFKTWLDEKYFIDDRDLHFKSPDELADVFTAFRKTQEPLREKPRPTLPPPSKGSLPPYPDQDTLPPQRSPFDIPSTFDALESALLKPLTSPFSDEPEFPENAQSGDTTPKWKSADPEHVVSDDNMGTSVKKIQQILQRFLNGTTGMGLIDASQRELWHTGYTSNRARQNVASFLTKHLGIDWRYGAEWYEYLLVDYDVSSNWSNWQYVAGVGNDPRGDNRIFNPVKQAFDYDKSGEYVKAWVVETREIEKLENVFQLWTTPQEELERLGLSDSILVTDPIKKIEFSVEGKPKTGRRQYNNRKRGRGNSNHNGTGGGGPRGPPSASGGPFGGLSGGPSGGFGPQNGVASDQGSTSHSSSRSPPNGPQGYRTNSGYRGDFRGGYRGGRGGRGGGYRGGRGSFSGRGGGFNNSHYAPNMPPNGHPNGQPRPQWTTTASGPIM
ncbi:putative cryptochrome DASH [Colletotrichum higginsianum]|uniref:Putative cryptochrome DASH n=1 Tax=Colletotrichum higginsianum TaxID=80884 RepID=A0A4T0VSP5_9PEZI|nr:putative cryptochrome DASH [Colletotrichum higginsianum]